MMKFSYFLVESFANFEESFTNVEPFFTKYEQFFLKISNFIKYSNFLNISIFLFIYLGSSCFKTNYISLDIPILSDISFEYSTKERYVKDSQDSPKELG